MCAAQIRRNSRKSRELTWLGSRAKLRGSMLESLRQFVATHRVDGIKWLKAGTASVLAGLSAWSCSFPNYGFNLAASGAAGTAGNGAVSGSTDGGLGQGGSSVARAGAGAAGAEVGAAAGTDSTSAGAAGSGQAGEAGDKECVVQVQAARPSTCSNGTRDGDEAAPDCGGSLCAPCIHNEACAQSRDCISNECSSNACVPMVQLETQAIVRTRDTFTLQFRLRLRFLSMVPQKLKAFSVRYYFSRGDAAEPIVTTSTQAVLNNAIGVAAETQWNVVRVLEEPPGLTSAYLEVTFISERFFHQMDSLELTQAVQTGAAPGRQFDQLTHYSFVDTDSYKLNDHAAVYFGEQVAWGVPPVYRTAPGCFFTAVNFAGPALTLEDHSFLAGDDSSVAFTGATLHSTATPFPPPSTEYLPLLQSGVVLDTAHATVQVPNGEYWAYPYVISAGGTNQADLRLQGAVVGTFFAGLVNNDPAWARLGPYPVTVSNGQVDFSSSGGSVRLAGVELFARAHN